MQVREHHRPGIRSWRAAFGLGLAALVLCIGVTPALGKKKHVLVAATAQYAVGLGPNSTASANATCPPKTHVTGGGYSVSPAYNPNGSDVLNQGSGTRTFDQVSLPDSSNTSWMVTSSSFPVPANAALLTSYARCEGSRFGKIGVRVLSVVSIPAGNGATIPLTCPPKTHAISGGYSVDKPFSAADPSHTSHFVAVESRRTGVNQWTIGGYNVVGATTLVSVYALCERDQKGLKISESSAFAPLVNNQRATVDPSCSREKYVVSGGFLISPATFPGTVSFAVVDETLPSSKRSWHVGLAEQPSFPPAPGASLTGFAYCKKSPKK